MPSSSQFLNALFFLGFLVLSVSAVQTHSTFLKCSQINFLLLVDTSLSNSFWCNYNAPPFLAHNIWLIATLFLCFSDPRPTNKKAHKNVRNDTNLNVQNLTMLIKHIKSYYEVSLSTIIMPNFDLTKWSKIKWIVHGFTLMKVFNKFATSTYHARISPQQHLNGILLWN